VKHRGLEDNGLGERKTERGKIQGKYECERERESGRERERVRLG